MLRSLIGIPVLLLATVVELVLLLLIIGAVDFSVTEPVWLGVHFLTSLLGAHAAAVLINSMVPGRRLSLTLFLFVLFLFLPFVGISGLTLALLFGTSIANRQHRVAPFWHITHTADLPYTAPLNRATPRLDSRGFIEQLMFEQETEEVYRKVLSARHIRSSESAAILKSAIGHRDEKIRLTAFQSIDQKVSALNREIQRLEADAVKSPARATAGTYMQIASNYRELLTLEEDEPVARQQLLQKAAEAALQAVQLTQSNANAHFLFGQISLEQKLGKRAIAAFENSIKLGISKDKVLPYLAEAAYKQRDFNRVKQAVRDIDPAFKAYPPLRQVAEFWS